MKVSKWKKNRKSLPEPGLYENVPFDTYREWPFVNNSSLGPARRSMAHYASALEVKKEPSREMVFGTFCHERRLEPLAVTNNYIVMPDLTKGIVKTDGSPTDKPKSTAEYRKRVAQFEETNSGKTIVTQDEFDRLAGMMNSLYSNKRANEWLGTDEPTEVSIVWIDPMTGLVCKGRIDKLNLKSRQAVDYKTTRDALRFEHSIFDFGYHRQAAFYTDGLYELTGEHFSFGIVAQEKEAPYGVRSAELDEDALILGRLEYQKALQQIHCCNESGEFPSYEDPERWTVPSYANPPITLSIDGEKFTF